MFSAVFPKIGNSRFASAVSAFYRSALYPAIIAALMVIAEIFSLEIPVFCAFFVLGVFCLLFADDAIGVLPILCCAYMTISPENFPGHEHEIEADGLRPSGTLNMFEKDWALTFILMLCIVAILLMVGRLAVMGIQRKKREKAPALTVGYLVLGAAFLLGGAGTAFYSAKEALFAVIEIVALSAGYFFFYYAVDWEKTPKWYVPAVFVCVGFGMLFEIADMYTLPGATENGALNRDKIFTGWGTYNNVGCVMAMCIPAAAYFAIRMKHSWLGAALTCLFMVGVLFTQSRGSILFGGIVFAAACVCTLVLIPRKRKIPVFIVYGVVLVAAVVSLFVWEGGLFTAFTENGFNDSSRFAIYSRCLKEGFLTNPVLGVGFYRTGFIGNAEYPTEGIPFFAHDTFVQLLTTGGIVLLLAYLFHRFQTVRVLLFPLTPEKLCLGLCILSMLLISLVDVHVFAIGPGLLYSVLLVSAERSAPLTPMKRKRKKGREEEPKGEE